MLRKMSHISTYETILKNNNHMWTYKTILCLQPTGTLPYVAIQTHTVHMIYMSTYEAILLNLTHMSSYRLIMRITNSHVDI